MVQVKVLKQLNILEQRKFDDEDIVEDVQYLKEKLEASVQDLRYPSFHHLICELLKWNFSNYNFEFQFIRRIRNRSKIWTFRMEPCAPFGAILARKCQQIEREKLRIVENAGTLTRNQSRPGSFKRR